MPTPVLTPEDYEMCRVFGTKPEDLLAYKKKVAADEAASSDPILSAEDRRLAAASGVSLTAVANFKRQQREDQAAVARLTAAQHTELSGLYFSGSPEFARAAREIYGQPARPVAAAAKPAEVVTFAFITPLVAGS